MGGFQTSQIIISGDSVISVEAIMVLSIQLEPQIRQFFPLLFGLLENNLLEYLVSQCVH